MLCPNNFEEIIEKDLVIERDLIAKGVIKIYNNKDQAYVSNNKPRI